MNYSLFQFIGEKCGLICFDLSSISAWLKGFSMLYPHCGNLRTIATLWVKGGKARS
jgi:hypothetical protein